MIRSEIDNTELSREIHPDYTKIYWIESDYVDLLTNEIVKRYKFKRNDSGEAFSMIDGSNRSTFPYMKERGVNSILDPATGIVYRTYVLSSGLVMNMHLDIWS